MLQKERRLGGGGRVASTLPSSPFFFSPLSRANFFARLLATFSGWNKRQRENKECLLAFVLGRSVSQQCTVLCHDTLGNTSRSRCENNVAELEW